MSANIRQEPNGGYGFAPRHADFHASQPWGYVPFERRVNLMGGQVILATVDFLTLRVLSMTICHALHENYTLYFCPNFLIWCAGTQQRNGLRLALLWGLGGPMRPTVDL